MPRCNSTSARKHHLKLHSGPDTSPYTLHYNSVWPPTVKSTLLRNTHESTSQSIPRQLRTPLCPWKREFRLDKHLLHVILLCFKFVVHLIQVLQPHPVRHHLHWVQLAALDHGQQLSPVLVYGSLTVADKADAALHERADIEVVCLTLPLVS